LLCQLQVINYISLRHLFVSFVLLLLLVPADDRGPGQSAADRDRSGGGGGGARMIGYAAASQSAAQVTAMLGGPPASDRRVQDQLNELLASKSRPELWEVLRLLKEFLGGDRQAASQYFAERPGLTKAVFQAQVLLGESGATQCSLRLTVVLVVRLLLAVQHRTCWQCESGVLSQAFSSKVVVLRGSIGQSKDAAAAALWLVATGNGCIKSTVSSVNTPPFTP
jgi:hypothetical protein